MYNSEKVSERIKELAKEKRITVKELLEKSSLGFNTMSNMKTSMPKADNLAKIADVLDCSVDYLLGRTNQSAIPSFKANLSGLSLPSYLDAFLDMCKDLSQQDISVVHYFIKHFLDRKESSDHTSFERKHKLKMPFPAKITPAGKAAAGAAVYDDCTEESFVLLPIIYLNNERFFSVEVTGDSMEPKIKNGDIVIVAKNVMPESGQLALVRTASEEMDEYRIKIFHKLPDGIKLISYNEEYPPVFIPKNEVLEAQAIVYVVHK